ncbi:MAG: L,D-transpeptidase [Myxococcales bacterium]|nr:L,D-transpeptidase [Myxococcales bacterium]
MVRDRAAYRFRSLPTRREWELAAEGRAPRSAERLDGDYFVAVDGEVEHLGQRFVRTARRRFVAASALETITPSRFHGEHDPEGLRLPIAFVIAGGARVSRIVETAEGRVRAPAGRAERYARFSVAREVSARGRSFVVDAAGRAVARDAVRVARGRERPEGIPEGARWVHVDLDEQILIAWEGDTPVLATMVSTGKDGYETPTGLFRVSQKYVSTTMRGDDPTDGVYDVGEVPWTLFYDGSYALHGAYWHDGFGEVRSHGCTNVAPADARWLFGWSTPTLPEGWHGIREPGTWVWVTGGE